MTQKKREHKAELSFGGSGNNLNNSLFLVPVPISTAHPGSSNTLMSHAYASFSVYLIVPAQVQSQQVSRVTLFSLVLFPR